MKFRSCAFSMLGISCSQYKARAWILPSPPKTAISTTSASSHALFFTTTTTTNRRRKNLSGLKASVMAEDVAEKRGGETDVAIEKGTLMAKGSVISFFRGGLAAVRIDEEELDVDNTPNVLSPTDVPTVGKKFASDVGGDLVGHEVVFSNGEFGVVVAHRPPIAFVYNGAEKIKGHDGSVSVMKELATISISDQNKMVQWNGTPIAQHDNNSNDEKATSARPIFSPIPKVADIALINNPMLTGTTMVDVLAPIGQGQNMLLVADELSSARGIVCDFIATQKRLGRANGKSNVKFVYAAIDKSNEILEKLNAAGVAEDVHVVMPSSNGESVAEDAAKAAEATVMAATACSIAESYALESGMNTVVVIDTLDQHKKLWDATTRVLVDVFGVDSVVKSDREGGASSEMRGFFSSIIQRSAQYKQRLSGGSVSVLLLCEMPKLPCEDEETIYSENDFQGASEKVKARIQVLLDKGVPLTATTLRKIDIPVPSASEGQRRLVLQHIDDLISMSDGQIWLDQKLRGAGQNPPLDPQRSITRIGIGADTESRADAPALRRVAEGLRLALSQAAHMEGAENTNASKKQVRTRNALLLAMHQIEGSGGRTLAESCTALLAAANGLLDDAVDSGKVAGSEAGQILMADLLSHVQKVAPDTMADVDQSLDLTDEAKQEILHAVKSFFSS